MECFIFLSSKFNHDSSFICIRNYLKKKVKMLHVLLPGIHSLERLELISSW